MRKPAALRKFLNEYFPQIKENPEKLLVWLEKGQVLATGEQSHSFEYQYIMQVTILETGIDIEQLVFRTLLWLRQHQPDFFGNPAKRKTGFAFEVDILAHDCCNIAFQLALTEAVIVRETDGNFTVTPRPEPYTDLQQPLEIRFAGEQK